MTNPIFDLENGVYTSKYGANTDGIYMRVCVYVYIYVCVYIYVYIYVYTWRAACTNFLYSWSASSQLSGKGIERLILA